jgi:hypothetical protein
MQPITISTNKTVSVSWFGGTLQQTGNITGPWTNVVNQPSPYSVKLTANSTNKFYRVEQ